MKNVQERQMTPERVAEILKKNGKMVAPEQAKKILELLTKMANIVVAQFLREDSRRASKRRAA